MWGDAYTYLQVLFDKYQTMAGIAVPSIIIAWSLVVFERIQRFAGKRAEAIVLNGRWFIALVAVFIIGFLAWRDEHDARAAAEQRVSELSSAVPEYSISAYGMVVHPLMPATDNVYAHLVVTSTSQGTLELSSSAAKISVPNKDPIDAILGDLRIRTNTPMTYKWEIGKLDDLPKESHITISVTINYGLPGKGPTRSLKKEIIVPYTISGQIVTSDSRDASEADYRIEKVQ